MRTAILAIACVAVCVPASAQFGGVGEGLKRAQQARDAKQKFDDIVVTILGQCLAPEVAKLAGILVSVNVLTGFAIGVFAVAIAEIVRRLEEGAPG